jgi:bifunctional enzyme CysN/CysC/sulfate adenylyltransferase subunit 1
VRRASSKAATRGGEVDFSLFTDGLRAEREQGITIDVAYRYFSTARRKFIIADTPGHVQYTRNMATGASTANVGVILIDARLGVLAQTRRHAYIASLLGIPHLAVCVNKMDLVDWDRETFQWIAAEITAFAHDSGIKHVTCLPVSALHGDQIAWRGDAAPWYAGPSLLEHLESVPISDDTNLDDLRFPVQYVIRPSLDYRGFAGQLASGVVRRGDEVISLPSGRRTTVASIDTYAGSLDEARAPMSVTLRLADEIDVSRGDMLVHAARPPQVVEGFEANVVWMSERPLDRSRPYLLKHTARYVRCEIAAIAGVVDNETLALRPATKLDLNDIARVTIRAHQPLYVDSYRENRATGAFVIIDALSNDTVAAGMILGAAELSAKGRVTAAERAARLGQVGEIVEVADEASAYETERALFDAGRIAAVVPAEAAAHVVAAGVIAIVIVSGPR